ncbi:MAG: hypothetical protein LUH22_01480 [Bacteroides sp.]|nr:hypothetical protein [Bacteroides sp.]
MTSYTYDKQGNIRTLTRYDNTTTTAAGKMDGLTMTYNGNQLIKTEDNGVTPSLSTSADFLNGVNVATEYFYDTNGNLKKDLNKGISSVEYNSLNLPRSLVISNSQRSATNAYMYAAGGSKLRLEHGSLLKDYVGNMIYEGGSLKRILIEDGIYYFYIWDIWLITEFWQIRVQWLFRTISIILSGWRLRMIRVRVGSLISIMIRSWIVREG